MSTPRIRGIASPLQSALALFVVRVGANDVHAALAADDLAIFATATDGWMNLHSVSFN
jgi:hypothetical protein